MRFLRGRAWRFAALVLTCFLYPSVAAAAQPGDLIKGASSAAVYFVTQDGKRLAFPGESTFFTWYGDFSTVKSVSDGELASFPLGGLVTLRPGIKMVKIQSDPRVYAVARNGTLRWIEHEWLAAVIFGTDWNKKVVDVPDSLFINYKLGDPVNDRGQYWWFQERDAAPSIHAEHLAKASFAPTPAPAATTGELVIEVSVTNDNGGSSGAGNFSVFVDGKLTSNGAVNAFAAGAHAITKIDKAGYAAGTWGGDCSSSGSVTVEIGKKKTCTINFNDIAPAVTPTTNTGTVTPNLTVVNDSGGTAQKSAVSISIDGVGAASDGAAKTLNPGNYKFSVTVPAGYLTTMSGDCDSAGNFTVATGQNKTCGISVNDQGSTLMATLTVVNDQEGTAFVSSFSITIDGASAASGVAKAVNAGPHTVAVAPRSGYAITYAGDCDSAGAVTVGLADARGCLITANDLPPAIPPMAAAPSSVKYILAVLWDPHRPTDPAPSKTYVENQIFGASRSVSDFYRVESGGQVEVRKAGVLGWYDADKPADHYWTHPADANDGFISGHNEKWVEAIRKADAEIDYSTYDADHDGILDPDELGILIVIPQNSPFGTNRPVVAQEVPTPQPLIVDGVVVYYISEVYMGATTDFSILAHEEGHLLFNLPDMYGAPAPAYRYSLMDISYLDSQLDPYNKYWLGWLTGRNITTDGYYLVNDVEKYREALKITHPSDPKEFFLIENRQRGAYDTNQLDTGIIVWNIYDERTGDWGRNNIRMIRPVVEIRDDKAAWHGPGGEQGQDLRLKWRDGSDSGITLKQFPASSANMRIYVDFP
jgi:M6 family metalloprotease-like protein